MSKVGIFLLSGPPHPPQLLYLVVDESNDGHTVRGNVHLLAGFTQPEMKENKVNRWPCSWLQILTKIKETGSETGEDETQKSRVSGAAPFLKFSAPAPAPDKFRLRLLLLRLRLRLRLRLQYSYAYACSCSYPSSFSSSSYKKNQNTIKVKITLGSRKNKIFTVE